MNGANRRCAFSNSAHHQRARLRASAWISPLVTFAAAEASGTDRSRRQEHAPNRSSSLVRGTRLAASGCRVWCGKCFGFPVLPDLVARLIRDAPLNPSDTATFYTPSVKGWTNHPILVALNANAANSANPANP